MAIEWYSRINILFMTLCILMSLLYLILWHKNTILSYFKLFLSVFIISHESIKLFSILSWYANFVELHILQNENMILPERLYTILENYASVVFFGILIYFLKEVFPNLKELNEDFKKFIKGCNE